MGRLVCAADGVRIWALRLLENYVILSLVLSINGKRLVPRCVSGELLGSPVLMKGGLTMVTYTDLIQIAILTVSIISLFVQVNNKKK